jgi:hypothetical protein
MITRYNFISVFNQLTTRAAGGGGGGERVTDLQPKKKTPPHKTLSSYFTRANLIIPIIARIEINVLKKRPTNAPAVHPFSLIYSHLPVSVVIRPPSGCSIKKNECNELQRVHPSKLQFLKCVMKF